MLIEPKPTMLVVDDDVAILRTFRRILEKNGYEVVTAETGKEAEAELEKHGYDGAVVDLRLPDMNGLDLLPRMQERDPKMVKIVLTGVTNFDEVCRTARERADIFLEKPVQPETLLNVLKISIREKNRSAL